MKPTVRFAAFFLTVIMLLTCLSGFSYAETVEFELGEIGSVNIHTSAQLAYLNDDYRNIANYANGSSEKSLTEAIWLTFSVSTDLDIDYYRIIVSTDSNFVRKNCYVTEDQELELYNVKIDTKYYWKVVAVCGDGEYESEVSSFYVEDGCPRNLFVEGITNVRDLGGWHTYDGCKVRQGLIYRTGKLNRDNSTVNIISEAGIEEMRNALGIKSEIDLRRCGPLGFEAPGEIISENDELFYIENGEKTSAGVIYLDGSIYFAGENGKIFRNGNLLITLENANGIVNPKEYSFDENGVMKYPSMVYYENGAISHSPLGRSDQNGIVRENGKLVYYTNGKAEELGVISLGGNLHYVSYNGILETSCSSFISKTNGLLPAGRYSFDELGRIVSDSNGNTFEIYPIEYGYPGSGIYDVNYFTCSMLYTDDVLIYNRECIKRVFEILSDKSNYPVIFHCSIGTDRTGVLAYLINGLVGVEQDDLFRDYLFSNFGNIGSSRSIEGILDKYVKPIDEYNGDSLSNKIYNYLNNEIGVPKDQLDAVINILKEFPAEVGNINRDEKIDEEDAVILSKYLVGYEVEIDEYCADIDGDGKITDWDSILISRFLAGWNTAIN